MLFLCTLIVSLIAGAAGMIPFVGFLSTFLLAPPLSLGLTMLYLNVTYGEKPQVGTIFEGFQHFGQVVLLYLMVMIFTLFAGSNYTTQYLSFYKVADAVFLSKYLVKMNRF